MLDTEKQNMVEKITEAIADELGIDLADIDNTTFNDLLGAAEIAYLIAIKQVAWECTFFEQEE